MSQVDLGSGYHECPQCKEDPDVMLSLLRLPGEGPTNIVACWRCGYTSPRFVDDPTIIKGRSRPKRGRLICECMSEYPEPQCPLHGGSV